LGLIELELAEQDPDIIALSRQFKATATELISVLEQVNLLFVYIVSVIFYFLLLIMIFIFMFSFYLMNFLFIITEAEDCW
jgi:ATP-dependent Lon protease